MTQIQQAVPSHLPYAATKLLQLCTARCRRQVATRAPSQDRSAPTDVLRSTKTSPSQKLSAALHLNSIVYLSEAICREAREPWTDLAEICHSNSLVLKKNFSCETFVDAGALWTASTLSSVGCRPFSKICIQDT